MSLFALPPAKHQLFIDAATGLIPNGHSPYRLTSICTPAIIGIVSMDVNMIVQWITKLHAVQFDNGYLPPERGGFGLLTGNGGAVQEEINDALPGNRGDGRRRIRARRHGGHDFHVQHSHLERHQGIGHIFGRKPKLQSSPGQIAGHYAHPLPTGAGIRTVSGASIAWRVPVRHPATTWWRYPIVHTFGLIREREMRGAQ